MNRKNYRTAEPPDIIVAIDWIDASSQEGPITSAELSGVHELRTVGWLIRENDEQITICMDYVPGNEEFRDVQHILKINVRKRTEFTVKP